MRKPLCVIAAALSLTAARAAGSDPAWFTPTPEQVAEMETRITNLPAPIYQFARYYTGEALSLKAAGGRTLVQRRVLAEFVPLRPGETAAVHVMEGNLPPLKGEGCIANHPDPPTDDVFEIYARCNRPGGWTPDAAGLAALERRLSLPAGAAPLASYVRHYAGIADDGVRLIQGVFVAPGASAAPGIVVGSEIELPLTGGEGCAALSVQFNPETGLGSARCNGPE